MISKGRVTTINLPYYMVHKYRANGESRSYNIRTEITKYLDYLNSLFENPHKLFPSRSELIRAALLFAQYRDFHIEFEEKKEEPYKIIKKLEYKSEEKEETKPKEMLRLYQYEFNFNLLISFLNEIPGKKTLEQLEEITGIKSSMLTLTMKKLRKKEPLLIKKDRLGRTFIYSLNKEHLQEMIKLSL